MPRIEFSYFWLPGQTTHRIECAVFAVELPDKSNSNLNNVLNELTFMARQNGLKIDKSALVYEQYGEVRFYGAKDLTEYLSHNGAPAPTNYLDV